MFINNTIARKILVKIKMNMLAITNNFDSFIVMYNNPKIIPTITKKPNKASFEATFGRSPISQ